MLNPTNPIRLHVESQGTSPLTVVFLHYFGGSARSWEEVISILSKNYRCLAPDLRGFGDSPAPATGYSVDAVADDVAALLRLHRVGDFVLVGHSMGGKIALTLAARQPAGLRGLVLIAPSPPTPEPIEPAQREHLLQTWGQRAAAEETFRTITVSPVSAAIQQKIIADNLRSSRSGWKGWLKTGSLETIAERMSHITVPALVLVGDQEPLLPESFQRGNVLTHLPQATLELIVGVGHLPPLENPEATADALLRFLHQNAFQQP